MNRTLHLRKPVGSQQLLVGWLLHPVSLVVLFLLSLAAALCAGVEETRPENASSLICDNLTPDQEAQAAVIYREARAQFVRLMGREVGRIPVRVCEVEQLRGRGEASRTVGQMQGVTAYVGGEIVVQISASRSSSFGRVLAHELTHAFVREAFGAAVNRSLSEGFAEYVASLQFPSEVKHNLRAASFAVARSPKLMPYVSGFEFCSRHAKSLGFAKFFESQIGMMDFGPGQLADAWKCLPRA